MKPRKNFRQRPKKSGARRKRRVESQKKKLIEAGYSRETLDNMTTSEVRELLKESARKKAKNPQKMQKLQADASKRSAGTRPRKESKKRVRKRKMQAERK